MLHEMEKIKKKYFSLELNLGHILIAGTLLVQGVVYTTSLKSEIAILAESQKFQDKNIEAHQKILDKVSETESKLERNQALLEERINNFLIRKDSK